MSPLILDCISLPCPQPVLCVKDALDKGAPHLEVMVDSDASKNNILRFARNQGHDAVSSDQPGGCSAITITASNKAPRRPFDTNDYPCEMPSTAPKIVYVIASDSMGRGSEELGWALLQTYIQTIKDIPPLPHTILLYNSGVKLVATASGALDALKHLQDQGVEILACGTCLDFFMLKSAIKVGQISTMYDIMDAMACADKLVSPF